IYDEKVEASRERWVLRKDVAQQADALTLLRPVDGSDEPRERGPRIGVQPSLSPQSFDLVRVDDAELETELLGHLDAPFLLQGGRAQHEDGAGPMAQEHLLDDEPGFDRLAEADVVGDQQVRARPVDRADEGIELGGPDADATTEGRLEVATVRVGRSAPPNRIQEGIELRRVVQACE